ncbi:hypothetical protein [Mucilaginibacter hurinus]|uniref:hypothetical protein n=1 Tax=Mucilaginibacter hurinus TaxID=2201324 RepID=UPI0018F2AC87|nr:hypothetical protein [Mucilaginibacter hurinus]
MTSYAAKTTKREKPELINAKSTTIATKRLNIGRKDIEKCEGFRAPDDVQNEMIRKIFPIRLG